MSEHPRPTPSLVSDAVHFGAFGAFVGLVAGILYSGIGFAIDVTTVGLNTGTALAFLALLGMPAIGLALGAGAGALWSPLCRRLPQRMGGWN